MADSFFELIKAPNLEQLEKSIDEFLSTANKMSWEVVGLSYRIHKEDDKTIHIVLALYRVYYYLDEEERNEADWFPSINDKSVSG